MATRRILLIDRHLEWLQFAQEALQERYDVLTAMNFEEAMKCCIQEGRSQEFDLIFVGLDLATNNLDTIKSLGKQWRFVVMFPVFQEDEKLRILFKAGVYDCADKPYEREELLKLVEDELSTAERLNGARRFRKERRRSDRSMLERILNVN